MPQSSKHPQTDAITEPMIRDVVHAFYARALPPGWPRTPHGSLGLTEGQIDRWFALLRATIIDICPPGEAAILLDRVAVIGSSFRVGLGLDDVARRNAGAQA